MLVRKSLITNLLKINLDPMNSVIKDDALVLQASRCRRFKTNLGRRGVLAKKKKAEKFKKADRNTVNKLKESTQRNRDGR